ncbi:hypothetical protein SAMN04487898_10658 [Pedobacter sp. ok626]|uniref:hypothetical protein n=1 Tax=Pedobacter sp. ok626 TaxID=1761882 RepID=UPI000885CFC3|nr:hypothetical protein [Pedobacter sp. ok626]SDK10610.1 hypothetical protein SAMN04487898_10658 [Pedobacter sp. ok626]
MKTLTNFVLLALFSIGSSIGVPYYNLAGNKVLDCNEIGDIQCLSFTVTNGAVYISPTPANDPARPQASMNQVENNYYNE